MPDVKEVKAPIREDHALAGFLTNAKKRHKVRCLDNLSGSHQMVVSQHRIEG